MTWWQPVAKVFLGKAVDVIDQFVEDKDKANQLKSELAAQVLSVEATELNAQRDIIVAEANGESPLQRNWRPITMLWFAGLVGAHWLGFTPENLSENQVLALLDIVQVGIGGYVIGRSAEKVARVWKAEQ